MRRVIFVSLISVLFFNAVFAEETVNTDTPAVKKEVMIFGDYSIRPKADIPSADTEKATSSEEQAATDSNAVQAIQIPMAEPDIPSKIDNYDTSDNNISDTPLNNVKKENIPSDKPDTEETVYKSEKEKLQEIQTPDPDPDTEEEKFALPDVPEENEYMINLDVSEEQLFKPKTEIKKVTPEKIELEKQPIFNIPSQNHGAIEIDKNISEKQMKGDIPSTQDYKLNKQLAAKELYTQNTEKKISQEEVLKNLHKSEKVVLDLKGRPLQYEDSGVSHSLVNIGTVFRF